MTFNHFFQALPYQYTKGIVLIINRLNPKVCWKEYIFQELVDLIYNHKENYIILSSAVKYLGTQTKAMQVL